MNIQLVIWVYLISQEVAPTLRKFFFNKIISGTVIGTPTNLFKLNVTEAFFN